MRLAQSVQDPVSPLVWPTWAWGATLYWLGELASARTALGAGALRCMTPSSTAPIPSLWLDPRWLASPMRPGPCGIFGYPDQALKRSQEATGLGRRAVSPLSLAYALVVAAWFHLLRREWQLARERAEALITLSTEQGFPYFLAMGNFLRGRALAEQGQVEEGIAQIHQGLTVYRATGAEMGVRIMLALLAEAYGKVGRVEEGLTVLAEALAQVDKTGERYYEAELYRLKGELLLAQEGKEQRARSEEQGAKIETDPQGKAEECFLKAIEISQRQQAKSLELRAVMSLSRLWQQQGKQAEAHQMLSEIYNWFTEGFDTKDLQEAKALMEELSH